MPRSLQIFDPALLMLFTATVGLAFKGVLAKLAYGVGVSVDGLLVMRFLFAVPLFWLGYLALRKPSTAMTVRDWGDIAMAGSLFFCSTYADFQSLSYISVGVSRAILFIFPALVLVIKAVQERRLPPLKHWVVFGISYLGLLMVVSPKGIDQMSSAEITGMLWSLGAAVSYACYWVQSQGLSNRLGSMRFTTASNSMTLLIMFAVVMPGTEVADYGLTQGLQGVGWLVILAVVSTVIPFFFLYEGIKRVGAAQAGLLSMAGPGVSVFLAWLVLGEVMTLMQLSGLVTVVLAISLLQGKVKIRFQKIRFPWQGKKVTAAQGAE